MHADCTRVHGNLIILPDGLAHACMQAYIRQHGSGVGLYGATFLLVGTIIMVIPHFCGAKSKINNHVFTYTYSETCLLTYVGWL